MKDTLETLRNALLIMAVLWLIYVLYKRLLNIMGKAEVDSRYPALDHNLMIDRDGNATLTLDMKLPATVGIELYDNRGNIKISRFEHAAAEGANEIKLDLRAFEKGRYYYKLSTPQEVLSQYFELS